MSDSEALASELSCSAVNDENVAPNDENHKAEAAPKKRKTHRLKQRFQVIRKLGQGTYGKVQLAINNETGMEVAIKTIKKSKVDNDKDLIRIRREIQIMSSIQHPHLVHIYEVFENKDKIVLVMQYASGGELYDYVSYHKVLSDSDARRLFRQVATAIYYCHKNKICHRDLKLENILLDEKGSAKIADFGLSNVFDERHFLETFCGSPLYASPEIVRGQPYFGPEVDCWSLGVLLYTLVYGAMPFDGSNFKKLVKQISEANYFEPPEKSSASDLIRRLLAPNPRERATIIDICLDPWVNADFDHSLLQVAEDLSQLTPVRCDMIAALAPVSPGVLTKPEDSQTPPQIPETDVGEKKQPAEPGESLSESNKRTVDNTSFNQSAIDLDKKKSKTKDTTECEEVQKVEQTTQSATEPDPTNEVPKQLDDKVQNEPSQQTETESLTPKAEKSPSPEKEKKTSSIKSNRSSSSSLAKSESGRRPGRLSIPKIWDSSTKIDRIVDTASASSLKQSASTTGSKTSFSPVGERVTEARKALERRCSVDVNRAHSLVRRRESVTSSNVSDTSSRTSMKKYSTRSISLNENEMSKARPATKASSPKKTSDSKAADSVKKEKTPPKTSPSRERDSLEKQIDTSTPQSSTPTTPISEEDKSLAKQIIKKNIAKAKLINQKQEKSASSETMGTGVQETATGSTLPETIELPTPQPQQQLASQPITRSYKKITFTKDGACITESGKVYTHESKDGFGVKRVEKKSMVTHIIQSGGNGAVGGNGKEITGDESQSVIQRSDSASSSGSTDFLDDIFEDHWSGDVFSNVKSIYNNIFENSNRRFAERRSIRSRADSLERPNTNDWFSRKFAAATQTPRFTFDKDEDDGMGRSLFDKESSSIFANRSMFSSSFKSVFDKDFDSLGSSRMQSASAKFNEKFKLLGNIDSIFDDKQKESSVRRVEKWLENDKQEDEESIDRKIQNYGTIGPKNFRRYIRTMQSADNNEESNSSSSNMFKSRVQMSSSSNTFESNSVRSRSKTNIAQSTTGAEAEFKLAFDPQGGAQVVSKDVEQNDANDDAFGTGEGPINVEEQSSLLEQLRKFGYKKLIDRKLSESSSTEDATKEPSTKVNEKMAEEATIQSQIQSSQSGNLSASSSSSTFKSSLRTRQHSMERVRPENSFSSRRTLLNRSEFPESSVDRAGSCGGSPPRFSSNTLSGRNESVMERIHRKSFYSRFNEETSMADRPRRSSITRPSDTMSDINSLTSTVSANNSSSNVRRGYDSPLILMSNSGSSTNPRSPFEFRSSNTALNSSALNSSESSSNFSASSSRTVKESSSASSSSYVIYQTSKTVKSSSSSSRTSTVLNESTDLGSGNNLPDQMAKRITMIKREFGNETK